MRRSAIPGRAKAVAQMMHATAVAARGRQIMLAS